MTVLFRPARTTSSPRQPRGVGLALAIVLAASLVATLLPVRAAQAAFRNTLVFSNGQDHITVGPNSGIYIDGTLDYDDLCRGEGVVDDFLYPASDVYIVPTGGFSGPLEDAGGNGPNTIVAPAAGGFFIGEPIAFTAPGGTLGEGVYDVVYDTCQDGMFDGEDEIFFEAITVEFPEGDLPAPSEAIQRIKQREKALGETWLRMHKMLEQLFTADKYKAVLDCFVTPTPACMAKMLLSLHDRDNARAQLNSRVQTLVLGLVMNVAKNHTAIWQDPPDADFARLTPLPASAAETIPSGGGPHDAFAGLAAPLAQEAALTKAYLQTIERYQGAQAAGDAAWALTHARAARGLSETLRAHHASSTALDDLRAAVADPANEVLASYTAGRRFIQRMRSGGLSGDERRELRNEGMDTAAINRFEASVAGVGSMPVYDQAGLLAPIDALLAARTAAVADLAASEAEWSAVIDNLAARNGVAVPVADAGGPYETARAVTLNASGSSAPAGTAISSVEWDLDGDGDFDDATGEKPTATFAVSGTHLVSVRVITDTGARAIDTAVVTTTAGDRPPVITASSPARAATTVVGAATEFTVTASDPDGDALTYAWEVDGKAVGAGAAFSYSPNAADVGAHIVAVDVTGGGRSTRAAWRVRVTPPDADGDGWSAGPDCDDTRADLHPGRLELPGNGLDDDCDPATADAPPGGLTGQVVAWGDDMGLGFGFADVNTPTPNPALPAVTSVESAISGGGAVLPDGGVRTWGSYYYAGDGTTTTRRTPTSPLQVGGAPGSKLTDVVQLSAEGGQIIALRANGSVIAWGENRNGQVGDRSTVATRLYPVPVVDADGGPVTGAVQVDTGENTHYILKADGTVWATGVQRCTGTASFPRTDHAVQQTLWGDDVVQIVGGDAVAIARKADGSLWACGAGSLPELGRGSKSITQAEMATPRRLTGPISTRRIVDVDAGLSTGVALDDTGGVWMWGRNLNGEMNALGVTQGHVRYEAIPVDNLPAGAPIVDVSNDGAVTTNALRADGDIVAWGANNFGGVGNGTWSPNPAVGYHVLTADGPLGGTAVAVETGVWNGLALVRPLDDPAWERPLQWIGLGVADASIDEGDGGTFTISLTEPAPQPVEVGWVLDDPEDQPQSGTAVIVPGSTSVDVPVTVADDAVDGDDREVTFTIRSAAHGVRLDRPTAIGTVVDDDPAPALSIASAEVVEGATSLTDVALKVTMTRPSSRDVVVRYATADGSATGGQDYAAADAELLIPAGQTSGHVHVAVHGDDVVEPHETFTARLSDPQHATIASATATVRIVDDEPVVVTVTPPEVVEGHVGTTPAPFPVSITAPPPGVAVTLPWKVAAGTAEIPADVKAAQGELTLDGATRSAVVTAEVIADRIAEPAPKEFFRLLVGPGTASDGRPVVVDDPRAATIIEDDVADGPPTVTAEDAAGPEGAPVALRAVVTDDGPVTTAWTVDDPGCTVADPASTETTVTCADDGTYVATITADDGVNPAVPARASVTVGNVAPVIGAAGYADGKVTVAFTDPGADTHRCEVDLGDGAPPVSVDPTTSPCTVAHPYAPGSYTAKVTIADDDGGSSTTTVPVTIGAPSEYPWDGFFPPVDNHAVNRVQAGQAVPMKFSLGGDVGLDVLAAGSPGSVRVTCDAGAPVEDIQETVTAGASGLHFDATVGHYLYVWKTQKSWKGHCRRFVLTLADGSVHTAMFQFR